MKARRLTYPLAFMVVLLCGMTVEASPGKKDHAKLRTFVAAAKLVEGKYQGDQDIDIT